MALTKSLGALLLVILGASLQVHGQEHGQGYHHHSGFPSPRSHHPISPRRDPYYGYGRRHGQGISPACRGHLPCYDITLNYILDGRGQDNEVPQENGPHFRHFTAYGLNRQQIIDQGRRAVAYFRQLYGVDYTRLPDEAFLSGRRINNEGVEFRPYVYVANGRFRLYTASTKTDAQIFNLPINEAGWQVRFTRQFRSRGTFTQLIPAGSLNFFGSNVMFPCRSQSQNAYYQSCRNILNPRTPAAPIVVYFRKAEYLRRFPEPTPFTNFDAINEHSVWGVGGERGICLRRPNSQATDCRITVTFPSFL